MGAGHYYLEPNHSRDDILVSALKALDQTGEVQYIHHHTAEEICSPPDAEPFPCEIVDGEPGSEVKPLWTK